MEEYDQDYNSFDDFEDQEFEFDCAMMPDGSCGAAGSENCDFECPHRREQILESINRSNDNSKP